MIYIKIEDGKKVVSDEPANGYEAFDVVSSEYVLIVDGSLVVDPGYPSIQKTIELAACHRSRIAEYPPIADYIDGIVKSDQAQIDKYIADCQAVKAKYPKPESV